MLDWLSTRSEALAVTSITVGELLTGVGQLPGGDRRTTLTTAIEGVLAGFPGLVLPYDEAAARSYAGLLEAARRTARAVGALPDPLWIVRIRPSGAQRHCSHEGKDLSTQR